MILIMDEISATELREGTITLPDNNILYWEMDCGYRTYFLNGQKMFSTELIPRFAISAALAVEDILLFEGKRIYSNDND